MSSIDFSGIYAVIGPVGAILIVLLLVAIYFAIKNFYYLSVVLRSFKKSFDILEEHKDQCVDWENHKDTHNPLVGLVGDIIHTKELSTSKIRAEVSYIFNRNFEHVAKDLSYLKLISVISPLLGLLGTVLGMVDVFQAIAESVSPDPTILAGGIWSALLTTIMGLSVAIPALMAFNVLNLKFKGLYIMAVEFSYKAVHMCVGNIKE